MKNFSVLMLLLSLSLINSCSYRIDICKNLIISIDTVSPIKLMNSHYLPNTINKFDTIDVENIYELTYTFHNISKDSSLVLNIDGINNILEYEVFYKGNFFQLLCLDNRAQFHDIVSFPFFINGPKFNEIITISPGSKFYFKELVNLHLIHQGIIGCGKENSDFNINKIDENKIHFKLLLRVDSSCVLRSNDIISVYPDLYLKPTQKFYPKY